MLVVLQVFGLHAYSSYRLNYTYFDIFRLQPFDFRDDFREGLLTNCNVTAIENWQLKHILSKKIHRLRPPNEKIKHSV